MKAAPLFKEKNMPQEEVEIVAQRAHGMAAEAMSVVHSQEKFNSLRFDHFDETVKDIKEILKDLDKKVDEGFRATDNKFWGLAVTLIGILLAISGFLIVYTLFPGIGR